MIKIKVGYENLRDLLFCAGHRGFLTPGLNFICNAIILSPAHLFKLANVCHAKPLDSILRMDYSELPLVSIVPLNLKFFHRFINEQAVPNIVYNFDTMLKLITQQHKALIGLSKNKEIIVTGPDKGSDVVIMNKADYIKKMEEILGDSTKFKLSSG